MTVFEFVFSLYSLLFGLALALFPVLVLLRVGMNGRLF
jgi:hypothetical protein